MNATFNKERNEDNNETNNRNNPSWCKLQTQLFTFFSARHFPVTFSLLCTFLSLFISVVWVFKNLWDLLPMEILWGQMNQPNAAYTQYNWKLLVSIGGDYGF